MPIICRDEDIKEIRLATEKEIQFLFNVLHANGKDWDAGNKQIVDYEWKPKDGEEFWYSDYFNDDNLNPCFYPCKGKYISDKGDDDFDYNSLIAHNSKKCFKIEAECQVYCDKLNEVIKNIK